VRDSSTQALTPTGLAEMPGEPEDRERSIKKHKFASVASGLEIAFVSNNREQFFGRMSWRERESRERSK
jgi:hypothetical protein